MRQLFDRIPVLTSDRLVIKKMDENDIILLKKMFNNKNVYKYTPKFLPEIGCDDDTLIFIKNVCNDLFDKKDEIILGIYLKDDNKFCGIVELYHYDNNKKQVSIGARFDEEYWNKGIASDTLLMAIKYLFEETDIERIAASNMISNPASGRVLEKCGFKKIASNVSEDWGFNDPVLVDKWTLKKIKKQSF